MGGGLSSVGPPAPTFSSVDSIAPCEVNDVQISGLANNALTDG